MEKLMERTLRNTHKPITVHSVLAEIDVSHSCEREHYLSFLSWFKTQAFPEDRSIWIGVDKDNPFWNDWLKHRLEIQQWLVNHEFAEWEEPKPRITYSLDERPGTVKLSLCNVGDRVSLKANSYFIMTFKNGMFLRIGGVTDVAELAEGTTIIKEED